MQRQSACQHILQIAKEMTKLKKNIFLNVTYQILILFLPLVTSSYLARIIGAEGIGRYSYAYSIALYFTYFVMLGLNKYGNRTIASVKNSEKALSRNFCEIFAMQFLCFVVCFALYLLFALCIADDKTVSIILSLFVLSSLFDINWFFFGMEMFGKTVIRNTIVKISTTIIIFILVKTRDDIALYTLIMAQGYLVSQLALWPYMRKYVKWTSVRFSDIRKHIRPNLTMFLPVIAVSVYRIMDKIMLGLMSTKEDVGFFENAEKIVNVPVVIIAALGTVMLPRVTSLIAERKESQVIKYRDTCMNAVIIYSIGAMFGIVGVSDVLSLWLFGREFVLSGVLMQYLSVTLIFLGVGNVVRTQYLIPYKFDRIYITSAFIGAFVNVLVNLFLIPLYHSEGAAIGTICAEASVCFYQFFAVRKSFPIGRYIKVFVICSIIGVIMWLVIENINLSSLFVTLLVRILIGIALYVGVSALIFKESLIPFVKRRA